MQQQPITVGSPTFADLSNFNLKTTIAAYLRKQKIEYKTFPGFLQFQNCTLQFDEENQYITIRSPAHSEFTLCTPYAMPLRILQKVKKFKLVVSIMNSRIKFSLTPPEILNKIKKSS